MALNQLGLGFLFTARDEASQVVNRIERSLGRLHNTQKQQLKTELVRGALGVGMGMGGLAGLRQTFGAAKEAGEFVQTLKDVKTIAGATTKELVDLREASYASQFSGPKASAKALIELAQMGYKAKDSIDLLRSSLKLMAASRGELTSAGASGVIAQTLKAFSLDPKDAEIVGDKLMLTANEFAVKASELPLLIGRSARGATAFKATLDETLITVGFARNVMGGIEVAATGVSTALERMIDPRRAKKLKAIGVDVADAAGKFRRPMDVLMDIKNSSKFQSMGEKDQAGLILKVFGNRSLAAVQAIFTQLDKGIEDMHGNILRNADAVDYYRKRWGNAKGQMDLFIEGHYADLTGQLELLGVSWEKLRTRLGEVFEPIYARMVRGIRGAVDSVLEAFNKISPETQQRLAKVALAALALVTAFGTLVAIKAGVAALGIILGALGTTLGALLWSMAPIAAGLVAFAAAGYLVYQAYKTNFGGLADFLDGVWKKISLAVSGLGQAFSKGEFSGAVMDDLNKAENSGVKAFVLKLYGWGMRIQNFFVGLGEGFKAVWSELSVVFGYFLTALKDLGGMFGVTIGSADDNRSAFQAFGETGRDVGRVLAGVLAAGIRLVTWGVQALTIVVGAAKDVWTMFGGTLGDVFTMLAGGMQLLFGAMQGNGDMFWRGFINVTKVAVKSFVGLLFTMLKSAAYVFDAVNKLVGVKSDYLGGVKVVQQGVNGEIDALGDYYKGRLNPQAVSGAADPAKASGAVGVAFSSTMPSPAQAANESASANMSKVVEQFATMMRNNGKTTTSGDMAKVDVKLDSEVLMSAIARLTRSSNAQGYMTPAAEAAE